MKLAHDETTGCRHLSVEVVTFPRLTSQISLLLRDSSDLSPLCRTCHRLLQVRQVRPVSLAWSRSARSPDARRSSGAATVYLVAERELRPSMDQVHPFLQRLRRARRRPPWLRIGATVYYRAEDILAFEAEQMQRRSGWMNEQSICRLAPDRAAIERHLDLLFGYLEGFAPVRLFGEVGTPGKTVDHALPADRTGACRAVVERLAVDAAASFHGVYVVPGCRGAGWQGWCRRCCRIGRRCSWTLIKGMLPPSAATSSITWERQVSSSPPAASPEGSKIAFISTGGLPRQRAEGFPKAHPPQECRRRARRR